MQVACHWLWLLAWGKPLEEDVWVFCLDQQLARKSLEQEVPLAWKPLEEVELAWKPLEQEVQLACEPLAEVELAWKPLEQEVQLALKPLEQEVQMASGLGERPAE